MDLSAFQAGSLTQQHGYGSFTPSKINHPWTWKDARINMPLAEANLRLGELNAFSLYVPNIDVFIGMHCIKEATTSSRIEGTRTRVEEALQRKRDIDPEQRDDWQEVQNYVAAMNYAIRRLTRLPLSTRLLKETHSILMKGVRGGGEAPGSIPQEPELDRWCNHQQCCIRAAAPFGHFIPYGGSRNLSTQ